MRLFVVDVEYESFRKTRYIRIISRSVRKFSHAYRRVLFEDIFDVLGIRGYRFPSGFGIVYFLINTPFLFSFLGSFLIYTEIIGYTKLDLILIFDAFVERFLLNGNIA